MPKSRNRKNHKKKVEARNNKLKQQQNALNKQIESLQEEYAKKMSEKVKENETNSGEVPLTFG